MNSQIEKKYDKIIAQIMNCKECRNAKNKKKGSDHIFKAEPANIGKNYGKGKRILMIGHVPYKKPEDDEGKRMNHNLKVYNSIRKYKQDSDNEDHIKDWTITKKGTKKYIKKILGHDNISYTVFTNCVKCQKENNGKPHVKDKDNEPSPDMYENCIKLHLKKEIKILDPDIIILCGASWFPKFYELLQLGKSGKLNTARRKNVFNKHRIILNSHHPSQGLSNEQIKENARKIKKYLNKN